MVLTLKFFYKRSWQLSFRIRKKGEEGNKIIWKKCGEWQKLKEKQKNPTDYKNSRSAVEPEGFPNYDEILATKYPGDAYFGVGDTAGAEKAGAEIWAFSNVSLSFKCSRKQVAPK
jgi:hypothetical protein